MDNGKYIVQTAAAQMPNSCWGRYRRIGLIHVESHVDRVAMISPRAKGVRQVVQTWEKLNVGKTAACAYQVALAEAEDLAAALNAGLNSQGDYHG